MQSILFYFLFIFSLWNIAYSINCRLEKDTSVNCDNSPITLKFYFDMRTNVCQPLFYRGCAGNENRFGSREECTDACVPRKPGKKGEDEEEEGEEDGEEGDGNQGKDMRLEVNMCKIPTDAKIDKKAEKCDNGCPTGYKCTKKNFCCPWKDHVCSLPASSGTERIAYKHYGRYAYQPGLNNCIRFSYFGLGGNYNNFLTYNDCKKYCMKKDIN